MNKITYEELVKHIYDYCNENMVKPDEVDSFLDNTKLDLLTLYFKSTPGKYVLKNSGTIEKFDDEKLFLSIGSASDEIDEPLTRGDIHNIVNKALHDFNQDETGIIPTKLIRKKVLDALLELGFPDVYKRYRDHNPYLVD